MIFLTKIKSYGYLAGLIAIILFVIYFLTSLSSYLNIIDLCKINIQNDMVRGNKETIFKAITLLSQEDQVSYKNLCKYVSTIKEGYCPIPTGDNSNITFLENSGCFIKGSKIIYIIPNQDRSNQIIIQRAESLRKSALFSKLYWDSIK